MDSEISNDDFQIDDFVVYPSHGVGRIIDEEVQNVAGFELKMFVLSFEKDKMTLKVPKDKIIKLKDDHGLDVNQLVKTDDKDKMVNFVEDPEDINKPN